MKRSLAAIGALLLVAGCAKASGSAAGGFCDAVHRLDEMQLQKFVLAAGTGANPSAGIRAAEDRMRGDVETADMLLSLVASTAPDTVKADAHTATEASRRYLAWIRGHDYDLFRSVTDTTWMTAPESAAAKAAAARVDARTQVECGARFHLLPVTDNPL